MSQLNGEIVAGGSPRGTCRSTRHSSEIDYFVVHKLLAVGVETVATVEGAGTRPHVPVALAFKPRLVTARALVLRQPPKIGTTRVYGPLPPPPVEWARVAEAVKELVTMTRTDGFTVDDVFRGKLEKAYEQWADLAEVEVEAAADDGQELPVKGTRGRRPQLRWRSVLPERPPRPVDDDDVLTMWRSIANTLTELKRITWEAGGHDDHADDDPGDDGPEAAGEDGHARLARQVKWDRLVECVNGIRAQLNRIGAVNYCGDIGDGAGAMDADVAEDDDGNITYDIAVVRMRAIAAAVNVEIRNARRAGVAPTGEAAAGIGNVANMAQRLGEELEAKLNAIAGKAKCRAEHEWRTWIQRNLHAGARNAHRFLRLPEEWRPTTVIDPDGVTTADPLKLVEGYSAKYDAL